ncbi:MAG: helix-turn-helix domain-containing protein [Xenococcaceae cyanobacterium MO_188.B19]|nr:helix-turn-helix domain-containing protein [Xenococcaceae cyanobacterium MO_188.B19]
MTTQTKIQGKFYPLQSEEWLKSIKQLTFAEVKILYYVRSLDPYSKGINLTIVQIAKDLSTEKSPMHRSTVSRALKSLDAKGFLEMELLKVHLKVNPKGFLSEEKIPDVVTTQPSCEETTQVVSTQPNVPPCNRMCAQTTECASTQQSSSEMQSGSTFQIPKTIKTYIDFKDSLSEEERESFLKFVEKVTNDYERPIIDLEAWLASKNKAQQNQWEVQYRKYQKQKNMSSHISNSNSVPATEKKRAIAGFQEQLKRQKSAAEVKEVKPMPKA